MVAADLAQAMEIAAHLPTAPHWKLAAYQTALDLDARPRRISLAAAMDHEANQEADEEKILGFAIACLVPPQAELESIAVPTTSQREGLGRRLFAALANEVRAAGAEEILLEVRASNAAALRFYRAAGMTETGRRANYYVDPVEDAILMRLRFA
jgi:ribosomal-protein-alanine acetyltransferase